MIVSLGVSVSDIFSTFDSGIVESAVVTGSSDGFGSVDTIGGDVDAGTTGEAAAGELCCSCCCCCCSNSYSLINRFLSECGLFEEIEAVGDADDDTGEVAIGGVPLL